MSRRLLESRCLSHLRDGAVRRRMCVLRPNRRSFRRSRICCRRCRGCRLFRCGRTVSNGCLAPSPGGPAAAAATSPAAPLATGTPVVPSPATASAAAAALKGRRVVLWYCHRFRQWPAVVPVLSSELQVSETLHGDERARVRRTVSFFSRSHSRPTTLPSFRSAAIRRSSSICAWCRLRASSCCREQMPNYSIRRLMEVRQRSPTLSRACRSTASYAAASSSAAARRSISLALASRMASIFASRSDADNFSCWIQGESVRAPSIVGQAGRMWTHSSGFDGADVNVFALWSLRCRGHRPSLTFLRFLACCWSRVGLSRPAFCHRAASSSSAPSTSPSPSTPFTSSPSSPSPTAAGTTGFR